MKRHWLVWVSVGVQAVFAIVCVVGAWVLWGLTRDPANIKEGKDTLQGLYIGLAGAAGCAVIYAVAAVGTWRRWRWGWWLGVALNAVAAGVILLEPITDRTVDWDDISVGLVMLAVTALLLLPPVRRWVFGKREAVAVLSDSVAR